jgi:Holliday junction resolvasome RuvABC endonuclease subunit
MSYFIGLDPGSRAAGVASLHEDGGLAHITLHEAGELPDRLVSLRAGVRGWLAGYAEIGTWCCVIEQPGTRFGGSALLASFGVCVEAARSVLRCPVMTPTSAAWKKLALGNGAAKKADVMVGARLLGYEGACQDTADAIVMADAARVYARQVMGAR